MKYLFVFLISICACYACPELDLQFTQGVNGVELGWDLDSSLYYAQIQLLLSYNGELFVSDIVDNGSYSLSSLSAGEYHLSYHYVYPYCGKIYTEDFIIDPPPDITYESSQLTLKQSGLWIFLGTLVILCLVLILRR